MTKPAMMTLEGSTVVNLNSDGPNERPFQGPKPFHCGAAAHGFAPVATHGASLRDFRALRRGTKLGNLKS
jgi:hypothetical protein